MLKSILCLFICIFDTPVKASATRDTFIGFFGHRRILAQCLAWSLEIGIALNKGVAYNRGFTNETKYFPILISKPYKSWLNEQAFVKLVFFFERTRLELARLFYVCSDRLYQTSLTGMYRSINKTQMGKSTKEQLFQRCIMSAFFSLCRCCD